MMFPAMAGNTVTVSVAGALSQLNPLDWVTYQLTTPAEDVEGTGAVVVPPVRPGLLYQVSVLPVVPVALSGPAVSFKQYIRETTTGGEGRGLTVIVKVADGPRHPVVGVTVIVPVIGVLPVLVALNDVIFPVPLAASPMAVLVLVQVYVTPVRELLKLIAPVAVPAHNTMFAGTTTSGAGLIVIV
jgi:hypothetical protein